jgi:hypothetical protein
MGATLSCCLVNAAWLGLKACRRAALVVGDYTTGRDKKETDVTTAPSGLRLGRTELVEMCCMHSESCAAFNSTGSAFIS